jgi:hypothetical protein
VPEDIDDLYVVGGCIASMSTTAGCSAPAQSGAF